MDAENGHIQTQHNKIPTPYIIRFKRVKKMCAISGEITKTVKMAPRSWKLTELPDKATQTMPLEWLQQGWQEKGSEEKEKKRPREEETEGEIEVKHLETGEGMIGDTLKGVQRRMLEYYEEEMNEQDL